MDICFNAAICQCSDDPNCQQCALRFLEHQEEIFHNARILPHLNGPSVVPSAILNDFLQPMFSNQRGEDVLVATTPFEFSTRQIITNSYGPAVHFDDDDDEDDSFDLNEEGIDDLNDRTLEDVKFKITDKAWKEILDHAGKNEQAGTCAICQEDFEKQDSTVTTLPICKHSFHIDCIRKALDAKPQCPLCRKEVEHKPNQDGTAGHHVRAYFS